MDKEKQIDVISIHNEKIDLANALYLKQDEFDLSNPFEVANCVINLGYRKINMDKWKRILDRNRKELQRLRCNEENLSKFGQHDFGYFKGRVSVLEDLFDELDMEVDDND